ncbi:acetyl-CoA carboxylase, biotin carboxylase subunit [Thalassovita litoralis]|jgi:acetyl-CoA carboxylase biotin carboxylase subunit|uniref:biotin carboxylase n=1 Tax=Thalassovita litoralis TaxID=1010611 RepID=A0A521FI30_9RHOB|nr:acetyl-CoA carboxylase biotin carboxylase subunit [Thalassovita litoralis]SMO95729.1 acetyl-CoA carboxylase, biotin carboxylase subunit [Thalassovita litoralis]
MNIKRLFIANRGEIAVRIVKAAKKLGVHTIQGHSEADAEMLAVKLADESICIGPAPSKDSYLNISAIIAAAKATQADAIHPGYGFLSESPAFARAVEQAGLIFIGPSADTIEKMGDKVSARLAAVTAGVPVVPGSDGRIDDLDHAIEIAETIGYPVMIKAAAGGGGRGIRIANTRAELKELAPQAKSEAEAAFGDGGLYIERAIFAPRHIEVQILGDGETAIHCYERECSLQRRRQKVWEEAGAACLDDETCAALCASAVALAKSVSYRGAGTLEYLYDEKTKEFFFIEMNTRIQVEHPVTEMITGVDLVAEMIRVCGGERLSVSQDQINKSGHAIEVRICAEDPFANFMPWPGVVASLKEPEGEGVRFDHFLAEGYQIPPFYDSLLGKVIVHAATRDAAIDKLIVALDALSVGGTKTTAPLHRALAMDADVRAGAFHTQWLEQWLDAGNLTEKGDAA